MWTRGHKMATHKVRPYRMSSARWELTAPLSQAGAASRGQNQPGSSIGGPEDAKAFLWDPSGTRWVQAKASLLCTTDPSHKSRSPRIWLWAHWRNTPSSIPQPAPSTRLTVSQRVNGIRKEEQNFLIFSNMDGLGRHDAMQNKSDREREIVYDLIYMWNQKKKPQMNEQTK